MAYGRYGSRYRRRGTRRRGRRTYRRSSYRRSYRRSSYRSRGSLRRLSRGLRSGAEKAIEKGKRKLDYNIERAERMRNYFAKQILVGASKYGRFKEYLAKGGIDASHATPFGQYKNNFGTGYRYHDGSISGTESASPASGNSGNAGGLAASSSSGTAGNMRGSQMGWSGMSSLSGTSSGAKRPRTSPFRAPNNPLDELLTIESDENDLD